MTTNANEPVNQNTATWMGLSYPTAVEVMDLLLFAKISPQSDTWAWRVKSSVLFTALLSHMRQTNESKSIATIEIAKALRFQAIEEQCRLIVSQAHQSLPASGTDFHDEDLMAQIPYGSKKLVRYYNSLPGGSKTTSIKALLGQERTKPDWILIEQNQHRADPILSLLDTFAEIEKSGTVLSEIHKGSTHQTKHIADWVQNFAHM